MQSHSEKCKVTIKARYKSHRQALAKGDSRSVPIPSRGRGEEKALKPFLVVSAQISTVALDQFQWFKVRFQVLIIHSNPRYYVFLRTSSESDW